ncbi:MAG: hypothetical protein JSR21_00980 [Proteobacteria bacterium]|nr:hypothetical protein [Pseudomonadota bacterium]
MGPKTGTGRPLGRRRALGLLAGLPLAGLAGRARAASPSRLQSLFVGPAMAAPGPSPTGFPDGATIVVGGPEGGGLDAWSRVIVPALGQAMPPGITLHRTLSGGADGVTAANQFDARGMPDGQSVLLAPGLAATAWLVGDPRAQFDVGHWVPVMAGATPGVVMARGGAAGVARGRRPRIAAASPAGPDLPALLALDLLQADAVPVFGLAEPAQVADALRHGAVDAVFVHGERAPDRIAVLAESGALPAFSLGTRDAAGAFARDPLYPDLPAFAELLTAAGGRASGPLFDAWCAVAAAGQMEFGLMLPHLTPAALVALWRRAGAVAAQAPEVQATAAALAVRASAGADTVAPLVPGAEALLELRRWLAARFNWHPT